METLLFIFENKKSFILCQQYRLCSGGATSSGYSRGYKKWPTGIVWKFRRGGRSHFVPAFQVEEDRTAAKICALSHKGTRPQGVDRLGSRRHLVTGRGAPGGAARVPGYCTVATVPGYYVFTILRLYTYVSIGNFF